MIKTIVLEKIAQAIAKKFKLSKILRYVEDPNDADERIDKLESLLTDMTEAFSNGSPKRDNNSKKLCDASTQTVSTGDINITKVYSESNLQPINVQTSMR